MAVKTKDFKLPVLILLCVLALFSANSHSSITDSSSKHNLASGDSAWSGQLNTTSQVCVFCHTPHGANWNVRQDTKLVNGSGLQSGTGAPLLLWNRNLPSSTNFSPYTSPTMSNTITEIRVYSLLCLSCHDGIGAMNVMTNPPSGGIDLGPYDPSGPQIQLGDVFTGGAPFYWGPNIGELTPSTSGNPINLSNDHPISIDYPTGDPSFNAVGTVTDDLLLHGTGYSLECSTCHNVHEEGSEAMGTSPFLRMSNNNSALCTTCHIK